MRKYSCPPKRYSQFETKIPQLQFSFEMKPRSEQTRETRFRTRANSRESAVQEQLFHYQQLYVIGIGGFGKVWKVKHKQHIYAMKEMSKALIIYKQSVEAVMNELRLLSRLRHPFIVNIVSAFQDQQNVYLVMDYLQGGDLRYHLGKQRRFSERQTKFFIASIIQAIEYIHSNQIIHRDVKPENLIFDTKGYLRLTDLGIARFINDTNNDSSGTPGYMAPEVMLKLDHGPQADFFAIGVIAFECMLGYRPYYGETRKSIIDQMLSKQVRINIPPQGWSVKAVDFINQLLQRKPQNRMIYPKNHPWFKDFPWRELQNKTLRSPYIPTQEDNFDYQQILEEDEENQNIIMKYSHMAKQQRQLFQEYSFTLQNAQIKFKL